MSNIFDILTSYYENDKETKKLAKDMGLTIEDVAEMRAFKMQNTDEGKVIYTNIMSMLSAGITEAVNE